MSHPKFKIVDDPTVARRLDIIDAHAKTLSEYRCKAIVQQTKMIRKKLGL